MNSDQIFGIIEEIAATSSKNEKVAMVKNAAQDAAFCRVLEYAYNPFKTYGIRKMPIGKAHDGFRQFDEQTWQVLDDLINRKLSGQAAVDAVAAEIDQLEANSAELFRRVIRKDLRAGFSESTCNKAVKGLIPDFPYMRCSLPKNVNLDEFDWAAGVVSQEKADGMFCNLDVEEGGIVRFTSRQGSPFPVEAFEALAADAVARLKPNTQTHGELLVHRNGEVLPREIGNGILNSVLSGSSFEEGDQPVFMAWDQIPLSAVVSKGVYPVGYMKRVRDLLVQLKEAPGKHIRLIETKVLRSLPDCYAHYRDMLARGKEGTIIKNAHAIWKDGTSKEQVKLKLEVDVDLKVVGIVPGTEGTKTEGRAGAFACESSCGGLRVNVTVKNEAMRDAVDADPSDWVGRVIVVRANSIMPPSDSNPLHSLFLPRMAETGYRIDKSEADSLARVRDQFESAIKAA